MTCKESELVAEVRGECVHWFTGTGEVCAKWRYLRQLKMRLLREVMSEVMRVLYGCRTRRSEVCESEGRRLGCFPVIVSNWLQFTGKRYLSG